MEKSNSFKSELKPWGERLEFARNKECTVVIIIVKKGELLSLQTHKNREEFWYVVGGSGNVIIGETTHTAKVGDTFTVKVGEKHRIKANENEELKILEISQGLYDENDIERLEDKYGRNKI